MTLDRLARSIATTAATCLLLSSAGVVAQQAADSSTGRFEQQRRPRLKVEGLTAAEAREWNAAVERLADVLASNPVASSPPAGICTRLSTWIEERAAPPRATTTFGVSIPERFDGQTCSQLTGSGVEIRLNDPFPFLGGQAGLDPSDNDPEQMLMLPREEGRAGPGTRHAGSGRRWVVLTRGSEPLVVPVTQERYLRHRITDLEEGAGVESLVSELRAALDALSPQQRQAPACFDPNVRLINLGPCMDTNRLVTVNPRYFDPALPKSAVQLILISTPLSRHAVEDAKHAELRWRIFETLDYAAMAQVLRP